MSRVPPVKVLAATACLLLLSFVFIVFGHLRPETASAEPLPADTPNNKVPAAQTAPVPPPGSVVYVTQKGDSMPTILRHYWRESMFMTHAEMETAIRQVNHDLKGNFFKPGMQIIIPGMNGPIVEKSIPVKRDYEVRAVYLTGIMAGSAHGLEIMRQWRASGGNAVVFDIKDSDGILRVPFQNEVMSSDKSVSIPNLPKLVRFIHGLGMHAIGRIAIFRDERLVTVHPELAVRSRKTGQPWKENGKLVWTDPSNPKVEAYNLALAKYAADSGLDEIQFDYVRFPAEGDQKDAQFYFEGLTSAPPRDDIVIPPSERPAAAAVKTAAAKTAAKSGKTAAAKPEHRRLDGTELTADEMPKGWQRSDVIANFLRHAYETIHPTGALFSLDVFGVMAWQRQVDLSHTGQDIVRMARHCDVLSPMIYPSHFFGMDGYSDPGDAPEHFISESMDRFRKITDGSGVVLRPWLQAFGWRTKTYSPEYIETQVAVARSHGGIGFLFWNARNDYSKPLAAMPAMRKDPAKFFRGDELPKSVAENGPAPAPVAKP